MPIRDGSLFRNASFTLTPEMYDEFSIHARNSGTNVSEYIRALVAHELGDPEGINEIARKNGWRKRRQLSVAD